MSEIPYSKITKIVAPKISSAQQWPWPFNLLNLKPKSKRAFSISLILYLFSTTIYTFKQNCMLNSPALLQTVTNQNDTYNTCIRIYNLTRVILLLRLLQWYWTLPITDRAQVNFVWTLCLHQWDPFTWFWPN